VANFCFQTQATNIWIGAREPAEYFREVEQIHPGALASQRIPVDPELCRVENYREFLKARRELLAKAANRFLEELVEGKKKALTTYAPEAESAAPEPWQPAHPAQGVRKLLKWIAAHGLPRPDLTD